MSKQSLISPSPLMLFLKELLSYKRYVAVAVVTIVLGAIVSLFPPYIVGVAIDQYLLRGRIGGFLSLALVYAGLMIMQWLLQMIRGYTIEVLGQRVVYSLRTKLFSKFFDLRLEFFRDKSAGDMVSRIINDTSTVIEVFVSGLLSAVGDAITLIGVLIMMIILSPTLTLASVISIPLIFLVAKYIGARMRSAHKDVRIGIGGLTSIVEESFSGIDAVKSFNKEKDFTLRFAKESLDTVRRALRAAIISGLFWTSAGFITNLSTVAVLIAGGYLVVVGSTTIGTVVAFTQYVGRFTGPINNIVNMYDQLQSALASLERIYEVLNEKEVEDDEGIEIKKFRGEIVFENVWFEYEKGRSILKNINFVIKPGEIAALVGPTGAGKTTIANLILRFYEPSQGRITIDGIDIRNIKRSCIRRRISYVPQETYLFPGSVIDNIRIGKPDASDKEIIEICKKLGVHEFIEKLPNSYYTDVGETGKKLSLGEKQLIAIARAMLRDPDIVILDEATSSVDPYTDELLRKAIKELMVGRTGVIIAHRLATARECNKVIVLEEGTIEEAGRFDELLKRKGSFYRLYTTQMGRAVYGELEQEAYM